MRETNTKKRITQSDVARAANVSRSTVSLVINGRSKGQIPEETRQRVLKVIKEMGYAPNVAARMLAQGKNQLIGVFTYAMYFPYETRNFFYPFLLGIERQATREDYNLLLFTRSSDGKKRSIYRDAANVLGMADGSIIMGSHPDREELRRLVDDGYPFVYLGRRDVPGYSFDWVSSDYKQGSYSLTRLVLEQGHRRMAFVGDTTNQEPYDDRLAGSRAAVSEWPGAVLHVMPEETHRNTCALVRYLTETKTTALVCTGTRFLASIVRALEPQRIRIPDDLSVVTVSDEIANLPSNMMPTHVNLNSTQVGAEAVKLLVERISGERVEARHILVPCTLVLGNTVAPLRS